MDGGRDGLILMALWEGVEGEDAHEHVSPWCCGLPGFGECLMRTGPAARSSWGSWDLLGDNCDFQCVETDDFQEHLYLLIML